MREQALTAPDGILVEGGRAVGVLVLAGSSGRVERDRCRLLAAEGMTAASVRYFGGPGVPERLDRVPLESFEDVLATLHERCDRLAVVGASKGAEAALLLAATYPEVDAVVALAPTDVVWAALAQDRPQRSSWTRAGEPLPFVPFDDDWEPDADPPRFADGYRRSLQTYADRVPAARIPVERIGADVVLAAGGDDAVWPALEFARRIEQRRAAAGLATTVVSHPDAGHHVLLPGETPQPARPDLARGGTPDADAALGRQLWPALLEALRGRPGS